jgi:hypothetical protein
MSDINNRERARQGTPAERLAARLRSGDISVARQRHHHHPQE